MLDINDRQNLLPLQHIDIGLGAEAALKVLWSFSKIILETAVRTQAVGINLLCMLTCHFIVYPSVQSSKCSELRVLEYRRDCMQGNGNMVKKVQEKCRRKYPTVRQMECLACSENQTFLQNRQLAAGVSAGRISFGRDFKQKLECHSQIYSEYLLELLSVVL